MTEWWKLGRKIRLLIRVLSKRRRRWEVDLRERHIAAIGPADGVRLTVDRAVGRSIGGVMLIPIYRATICWPLRWTVIGVIFETSPTRN